MSTLPGPASWIDKVAETFTIVDRKGAQIRSYKQAELKDLPEMITGVDAPCVVHHIRDVQPLYSAGGPTILHYEGVSDFHLFKNISAANWAEALQYFPLILAAAMGNVQLDGTVNSFVIPHEPRALWLVTYKRIDGSDDHDGIQVRWNVKQTVTGSYTISA